MKTKNYFTWIRRGLTGLFFGLLSIIVYAQAQYTIEGRVSDQDGQSMPYANIAIRELPDSSLVGGTITGEDGTFSFQHNIPGIFMVTARFIGHTMAYVTIETPGGVTGGTSKKILLDAGTLVLQQELTAIDEVVIRKNRIKAKQQVEHTTYYVNSSMRSASQTGIQLLNMVPGVQVDLLNTISLDGSKEIVILVNGLKRDADYLAQLDADLIDRVEIRPSGGMRYGAEVSGVINLILKESNQKGLSGHLYANVPTKSDEMFSFPSASLSYTRDKTTWYTSYNGGFSCFSIEGENTRTVLGNDQPLEIIRTAQLDQENWSHKVHFGMDRFNNERNQLSLYGFVSGFSNEQDGVIEITRTNNTADPSVYTLVKDDSDRNRSAYSSVYFRHRFIPGSELILEGSYYRLFSQTGTELISQENVSSLESKAEPMKDEINSRALFTAGIGDHLGIEMGLQYRLTTMQDKLFTSFCYTDQIIAGYFTGNYRGQSLEVNGGLRVEHSNVMYTDVLNKTKNYLLPRIDLKYAIKPGNNLKASFRKRVTQPTIYQLNPNPFSSDPFILQRGNPGLFPVVIRDFSLMYNLSFRENFLSVGLVYKHEEGVIEDLTRLTGLESFLEEKHNLGDLSHIGVKVIGSVNLHERFSLNPHFECSRVQSRGNALARSHEIPDRTGLEIRGEMSTVWTICDDLSLSASMQFQTTSLGIQRNYHEGVLYFLNVEKLLFDRLKFGITSAIPFKRSFTYQGFDISSAEYKVRSEDKIRMSMIPVWFKLKYSFASGIKTRRLDRDEVFEEKRVKKGF